MKPQSKIQPRAQPSAEPWHPGVPLAHPGELLLFVTAHLRAPAVRLSTPLMRKRKHKGVNDLKRNCTELHQGVEEVSKGQRAVWPQGQVVVLWRALLGLWDSSGSLWTRLAELTQFGKCLWLLRAGHSPADTQPASNCSPQGNPSSFLVLHKIPSSVNGKWQLLSYRRLRGTGWFSLTAVASKLPWCHAGSWYCPPQHKAVARGNLPSGQEWDDPQLPKTSSPGASDSGCSHTLTLPQAPQDAQPTAPSAALQHPAQPHSITRSPCSWSLLLSLDIHSGTQERSCLSP